MNTLGITTEIAAAGFSKMLQHNLDSVIKDRASFKLSLKMRSAQFEVVGIDNHH